jgi:hypothetical protein
MQLDRLSPELPQLLVELGIRYDPDKLAAVLDSRWPQVRGRADGQLLCSCPRLLDGSLREAAAAAAPSAAARGGLARI